jgi:L-seryl-tRNA(Ser) seleniumtransferase
MSDETKKQPVTVADALAKTSAQKDAAAAKDAARKDAAAAKTTPEKDAPATKGAPARKRARAESGGALRGLAAVDEVLRQPTVAALCERYPRALVVDAVRAVVDRLRREIIEKQAKRAAGDLTAAMLAPWVEALLAAAVTPSLRRVINATGVVVHTNLGRSALPAEALEAIVMAAAGYSDLEFDLGAGERASRQEHVHDVLCLLTGAEDALAVNNNAAAVLLALAATSRGGDALVSRGQLVEIGDGFRIPDILVESGAALVEVGTTNRTYLKDYERAWSERARAVLRVHTSNYRIVGFTSEPTVEELARFAHERGGVLVDDLGSGALAELDLFADEPSVSESIAAGADVVTFSGDKLLGGPQAGIAVGSAAVIGAMRRHPLARAVRIDKLDLAALDALLRLYLDPARAIERIPTLAMLAALEEALHARAAKLRDALIGVGASTEQRALCLAAEDVAIVASVARAGAGALPVTEVPSVAVAVAPPGGDAEGLAARLRRGLPGVVGRVHEDHVLFDMRTVRDGEVAELAACVLVALG